MNVMHVFRYTIKKYSKDLGQANDTCECDVFQLHTNCYLLQYFNQEIRKFIQGIVGILFVRNLQRFAARFQAKNTGELKSKQETEE